MTTARLDAQSFAQSVRQFHTATSRYQRAGHRRDLRAAEIQAARAHSDFWLLGHWNDLVPEIAEVLRNATVLSPDEFRARRLSLVTAEWHPYYAQRLRTLQYGRLDIDDLAAYLPMIVQHRGDIVDRTISLPRSRKDLARDRAKHLVNAATSAAELSVLLRDGVRREFADVVRSAFVRPAG